MPRVAWVTLIAAEHRTAIQQLEKSNILSAKTVREAVTVALLAFSPYLVSVAKLVFRSKSRLCDMDFDLELDLDLGLDAQMPA